MIDSPKQDPNISERNLVDAPEPHAIQDPRDATGFTRRPDDGRPSDLGVSDTPNAAPEGAEGKQRPKIMGEEIPTTGEGSERQPEKSHV